MSQRYLGGIITANPTLPTLSSASGVWTLEQDFQNSASITPQVIGRSVRLRSSASAYFNRTPASASNRNTWTWSAWVKRGVLGSAQTMFVGYPSSTVYAYIGFTSSDQIRYASTNSGASLTTTPVYRDPSSWYHIVFAYDDTQATASNRLKLYVNGVQVTAFGTASYPTQNFGDYINSANVHNIGRFPSGVEYCDCYFAEMNFIDGQALTPSSFGAFDGNGIWQPLSYRGTYGTNGFYLNFSDNSAATAATIGKDYSGNGNNWTPNNISVTAGVTYDSMLDVPTMYADGGNGRGNYCVLNPLDYYDTAPINGNLTYTRAAGVNGLVAGSFVLATGKWYWEVTIDTVRAASVVTAVGVSGRTAKDAGNNQLGYYSDQYAYVNNGNKANNNTYSAYGASYTTGDVIGIAYDADVGTLTFYKNGSTQGTAYSSIPAGNIRPMAYANGDTQSYNFGQRPFAQTPPTGFLALNTQNLPAVTINNGAQYMAATTYTGNGSTQTLTNGGNNTIGTTFQPDFVWLKSRSNAYSHALFDSVRGATKQLSSDSSGAEATYANSMTAFNSNGFSVGSDSIGNGNTSTFVGWQWKESPTAGFDIISQTLGTTGINTITHNLGVVPTMVIAKRTDATEAWLVYQSSATTQSQYLSLNSTAAVATSGNLWGSSAFTSSQFYFTGTSGTTYVFYAFAPVKGYSAFGKYTGNGSTDGPFVYLGFRPRYVMVKNSSTTGDWIVYDTSRNTSNVTTNELYPNLSNAEYSRGDALDILSNGFKIRTTLGASNGSGNTIIYAAFAENPFQISRAR